MPGIEFNCLPTMIGTLPHKDGAEACRDVWHYLRDIPAWPQLPQRAFFENMYVQFSQGFPGIVVRDGKIYVDRAQDLDKPLERLYSAYLENDYAKFPVSPEYGAGFHEFLRGQGHPVKAVKGQVTGPVSFGMTILDNNGKSIAYDEVLADACAKLLKLKAAWMENELKIISKNTIIFVDEPYLHSIGSAFFALSREKVVSLLEEVFTGIQGLKGVHCCGNTDWSILLGTSMDILNFDAYEYARTLALYPQEVKKFIDRGGIIAWGIIPNQEETLVRESVASLKDRLEEAMAPFTRRGVEIPFRQLVSQSLLTPSCSLAGLTVEAARNALELLGDLSGRIRSRYG